MGGNIYGFQISSTFSSDGKYILGGCQDGTIRMWDVATGEIKKKFKAHNSSVSDMTLSTDGATLVSRSAGGEVLVWNFASILGAIDTHN